MESEIRVPLANLGDLFGNGVGGFNRIGVALFDDGDTHGGFAVKAGGNSGFGVSIADGGNHAKRDDGAVGLLKRNSLDFVD